MAKFSLLDALTLDAATSCAVEAVISRLNHDIIPGEITLKQTWQQWVNQNSRCPWHIDLHNLSMSVLVIQPLWQQRADLLSNASFYCKNPQQIQHPKINFKFLKMFMVFNGSNGVVCYPFWSLNFEKKFQKNTRKWPLGSKNVFPSMTMIISG